MSRRCNILRILAFSDAHRWEDYEEIVDMVKPDVICLAGDLTSDGGATFWDEALALIPSYRSELEEKLKELGVKFRWYGVSGLTFILPPHIDPSNIYRIFTALEQKYRNIREFHEIVKRIHVEKFYSVLEGIDNEFGK